MIMAISKRNKMVKSVSFFIVKAILTVIVFVFTLLPSGCKSYEQMGETAAEGHRRHIRNSRLNQQQLMADLDSFWLVDRPSKLTDKRIP
ncbi:MAG: hypothetical protein RQ760_12485 [Sedimentisphaerales bacterium]|nr:hypothetical protein [Sedimentisphaerales bacterium]